jgi:23S rRNA (guanine745-N1)-methyltransferase
VYRCANGHCFDVARQGYVNLLSPSRRHSRAPGDNREMVLARRRVLDSGRYLPVAGQVNAAVLAALPNSTRLESATILDAGAGEGYYLAQLVAALSGSATAGQPHYYGVDVSRFGMQYATHRTKSVTWLVASVVDLPLAGASLDVVVSIFAPLAPEEFRRVLQPDGALIVATPGPDHLRALREMLYPTLRPHRPEASLREIAPFFVLATEQAVQYEAELATPALVGDMLTMTPFGWNIDSERRRRAEAAAPLRTAMDVVIRTYRPVPGP